MEFPSFESLHLARTARTYPVGTETLVRAVEEAVHGLPRWELERTSEDEVRAVCRPRFGVGGEVTVGLLPLESGDHTNIHASFESRSRTRLWDLGESKRRLGELLTAIDANLMPET